MIKDRVWDKFAKENEMLCIGCLEKRIGRELKGIDFKNCPVNTDHYDYPKSERLMKRLNSK